MATKGERQALLFLAAVALLGAGTRWYRARHVTVESGGLDRQIEAVEQSRAGQAPRRTPKNKRVAPSPVVAASVGPIDLDRASAEEIETLPGIGPALARRIVGDRDANGPFGCLVALDQVRGIGPALLRRLDSLATFSGPGRPACSGAALMAVHGQDDQQQNGDGDDYHTGKLADAAKARECPASLSEKWGRGRTSLYPTPVFRGTFYS